MLELKVLILDKEDWLSPESGPGRLSGNGLNKGDGCSGSINGTGYGIGGFDDYNGLRLGNGFGLGYGAGTGDGAGYG